MKGKKYRVVAAALCAAFLLCGITTTAYAGGGEEWEDGTGGPEWEGLDPVEPTPAPEPEPNPFTPDGQGTMVDNATDQDGKEFFTIMAAAVDRAHALAGELQTTEAALSKVSGLMGAVVDYAKARPVFDGYKAARYSKKYLAEHEAELATYRAARAAMNELLGGEKLPKMDALKKQRRELADKKKALYAEYRQAQRDMREAVAVKANIDHLLGLTNGRTDKEQTR